MARDSFIFYKSFYEAITETDVETQVQLYNAICKKALYGEDCYLEGTAKILFTLIKPQIEANSKRYVDGQKGGRPKGKTTGFDEEKTTGFENKKPNNNVNENVNVNENIITACEDKSSTASAKASKHKYGEYKNVLLKDEELQKLKLDYANWKDLIEFLDEYIEMKGYKAKSHYLALRKWVVNAVKDKKSDKISQLSNKNYKQRNYGDLDNLYANMKEV